MRRYWSRRTKKAMVPLPAIMEEVARRMRSEYWTVGPGSGTHLIVSLLKRRKAVRGALDFSDRGADDVTFASVDAMPDKRVYELLDGRAPDEPDKEEPLRHVYFLLEEKDEVPVWDFVALGGSFLALLFVVLATASYAYSWNL